MLGRGALGVGAQQRTHVRAAGPVAGRPAPHARAGRSAPSRRPAQPSPRRVSRARHREAARRPPRAAEGRGCRPHCSSPSGGPSPSPSPGRGAGPPEPRNVGSRPAFVSRARAAGAPRPPLAAGAALCRGAGDGDAGRGAGGRSLSMDLTVSELMELFLQSPLVTWVSAPGSPPHCWCTGSSAARPGSQRPDPPGAPGSPGSRGTLQVYLAGARAPGLETFSTQWARPMQDPAALSARPAAERVHLFPPGRGAGGPEADSVRVVPLAPVA